MRVFVFSSLLLIALTGCKPVWDPTFMPSGYSFEHKEYKTPPGPKAAPIGYPYSAEQNAAVLESWRVAVSDLVLRAKAHDINPAGPVYLTSDLPQGAFRSAFDHSLREELQASGVTLTTDPAEGMHLFYSAYDPADPGIPETTYNYNDEPHHPNVAGEFLPPSKDLELVLATVDADIIGTKVASVYKVPSYGFKPAGYAPLYERPRMPPAEMSEEEPTDGYND